MRFIHFIGSLYAKAFTKLDRNVWILSLVMFVNRTGSMVLLFSSLYLTNELKLSLEDAGLALSCYGIGSILGSYAGGWLTDRWNYFDIMVGSLILSGLFLPAILFVDSLYGVCLVMLIYSFIADAFRPALSKGIAFYSSTENRTRSVGLIRLAINLGFSLGPLAAGFIAYYVGYKPLYIIDGATSILAGIVVIIFIPRKPVETVMAKATPLAKTKSAYSDGEYLFFILLVAFYGVCFFQLFASVPKYLDQVWHYTEAEIGFVLFLNGAIVVLIEMPLMALLENQRRYFRFIILGALCIPAAFLLLVYGNGLMLMVCVYTLVITFSEIFAMPFMMNFSLSRPAKERQGEYSALYSIAFGISNTLAPTIGLGVAGLYGFDRMFHVLIIMGVVCAAGFYALNRHLEQQGEFDKVQLKEAPPVISEESLIDTNDPSESDELI